MSIRRVRPWGSALPVSPPPNPAPPPGELPAAGRGEHPRLREGWIGKSRGRKGHGPLETRSHPFFFLSLRVTPNLPCLGTKCVQKGKGERAAEKSALGSNRLPMPYVYVLYGETVFRLGLEGVTPEGPFPARAAGAQVRANGSRV